MPWLNVDGGGKHHGHASRPIQQWQKNSPVSHQIIPPPHLLSRVATTSSQRCLVRDVVFVYEAFWCWFGPIWTTRATAQLEHPTTSQPLLGANRADRKRYKIYRISSQAMVVLLTRVYNIQSACCIYIIPYLPSVGHAPSQIAEQGSIHHDTLHG